MEKRLIIGIIILIICCVLAFLIPKFWGNNCRDGVCSSSTERRIVIMGGLLFGAFFMALLGLVLGWFELPF